MRRVVFAMLMAGGLALPGVAWAAPPSYATGRSFSAYPGYSVPYSRSAYRRYTHPVFEYPDRHFETWRQPGSYYPHTLWR